MYKYDVPVMCVPCIDKSFYLDNFMTGSFMINVLWTDGGLLKKVLIRKRKQFVIVLYLANN